MATKRKKSAPVQGPVRPIEPEQPFDAARARGFALSYLATIETYPEGRDPKVLWQKAIDDGQVLWAISHRAEGMIEATIYQLAVDALREALNVDDADEAMERLFKAATGYRNRIDSDLRSAYWRPNSTSHWANAYKTTVYEVLAELSERYLPRVLEIFSRPGVEGFDSDRLARLAKQAEFGYTLGGLCL